MIITEYIRENSRGQKQNLLRLLENHNNNNNNNKIE